MQYADKHNSLTTCFNHTMGTFNTNPYNPHYLNNYLLFQEKRAGCQVDVIATSLVSLVLIMAAEAVEMPAATSHPLEISNSLPSLIYSPGGSIFRTIRDNLL